MTGEFIVLSERAESYQGKRGTVNMRILSLIDQDKESPFLNTLDYVVPADETAKFNGELAPGKVLKIGVSNIRAAFGGRFRLEGRIITQPQKK